MKRPLSTHEKLQLRFDLLCARVITVSLWGTYIAIAGATIGYNAYIQRAEVAEAYSIFVTACMNGHSIVVGDDAVWCMKL